MKEITISAELHYDKKFFAIIPAINLNFHGKFTLEFEWLVFGVYIHKAA